MESDWCGLQRINLWNTFNQFVIGCLQCAEHGAYTCHGECGGNQYR